MPSLSAQQASAILGRAKVFAWILTLGIQKEFEYVRALPDWAEKLKLLRATCWSLNALICEPTPSWMRRGSSQIEPSEELAAICGPRLRRAMQAIDRVRAKLQPLLSLGFEDRVDRFAAEQAMSATFEVLRLVTDVANSLESAQIEVGVADDDGLALRHEVESLALPPAPGVDLAQLLELVLALANEKLRLNDPLQLCMAMRSLWCCYAYVFAVDPRYVEDERLGFMLRHSYAFAVDSVKSATGTLHSQGLEFHRRAEQWTDEILQACRNGKTIFSSALVPIPIALIEECLTSNRARLELLQKSLNFEQLIDLARLPADGPKKGSGGGAEGKCQPLLDSPKPRVLLVGDNKRWSVSIADLLQYDFDVSSAMSLRGVNSTKVDLAIVSADAWPEEGPQRQALAQQLQHVAARVVCFGNLADKPLRKLCDDCDWHLLDRETAAIDQQFVHVFMTGNATTQWCQEALSRRRKAALGNLAGEWLFQSYLIPEFPLSAYEWAGFEVLPKLDRVRERGLPKLPEPDERSNKKQRHEPSSEKRQAASFLCVTAAIEKELEPPRIAAAWRPLVRKYGLTEVTLAEFVGDLSVAYGKQ